MWREVSPTPGSGSTRSAKGAARSSTRSLSLSGDALWRPSPSRKQRDTIDGHRHAAASAPGTAVRVTVAGRAIAVFNLGTAFRPIDAICTHVGGPLERGPVSGTLVTCPRHGSQFDLTSGEVRRGPAGRPALTYSARLENQKMAIETP